MVQVHAANKPIDRGNDDQVLRRIAELAVGYSGAELANLLNEAAILAVSTPEMWLTASLCIACVVLDIFTLCNRRRGYASLDDD